ncbi:hypothetical protein [Psychrobacter sp. DM4]|uniref:hypothetical protein n=1 Tax=Psychrobacter sp. DM4 TaxID=3440637 RepID=UPI003F50B8B9
MKNDKTTSDVTDAAQNADADQIKKNLDDQPSDNQAKNLEDNQAPFIDESARTDQ